jgi:hypothetical protein
MKGRKSAWKKVMAKRSLMLVGTRESPGIEDAKGEGAR